MNLLSRNLYIHQITNELRADDSKSYRLTIEHNWPTYNLKYIPFKKIEIHCSDADCNTNFTYVNFAINTNMFWIS